MNRIVRRIFVLACLSAAAGCASSPPTRFVTLDVAAARARAPGPVGVPVAIGKVDLPPELDRPQPVRRRSGDRLDIPSGVRWAAPLGTLIQRTLALDLAARLPEEATVLPGQPDPSGPLRVVVVIFRTFSAGADDVVTLDARWTVVRQPADSVEFSKDARLTVRATSGSWADVAEAMSTALGRFADRIAGSLTGPGSKDESGGDQP